MEFEVHDVQAFLQPLDEKLALPCLARLEARVVVGRADFSVRAELAHGLDGLNHRGLADAREPQRIVARLRERAGDAVRAGWQHEFGGDVVCAETRAGGRAVLRENHHAEELVQEADVARNDHQRRDRRNLQPEVGAIALVHELEIDALDLHIELRRFELWRKDDALAKAHH